MDNLVKCGLCEREFDESQIDDGVCDECFGLLLRKQTIPATSSIKEFSEVCVDASNKSAVGTAYKC